MRYGIEVTLEVRIHHMHLSRLEQCVHAPQRILGPSSRTEAVTVLGKFSLEDAFQDMPQRALHDPFSRRRYAQRSLFPAPGLVDPLAPAGLRSIRPRSHLFVQPLEFVLLLPREVRQGLFVYSRAAAI